MKEYNVILKKDVDYDSFWNDMESDTDGGKLHIPNRAVEYTNERLTSLRQCWYKLTDEEAELVRGDDRVLGVEIPPEHRTDIQIGLNKIQQGDFTKTTSNTGAYINWGLVRCNFRNNAYGTGLEQPDNYNYVLDGTGVDVVIQDSGIQVDHPEFTDKFNVSRVQQINWYTESGIAGSQSANHYRDFDGHGTHVAGIAAGKNYGWAKGARIYSQKLEGLEGDGDSSTGISISDAFDTIKGWHMAKSGSRPTVVNMSWGYGRSYTSASQVVHRGSTYSGNDLTSSVLVENNYGLMNYQVGLIGGSTIVRQTNVRVDSVDTDIQEMIDVGIVVVVAAGNRGHKIDMSGGVDYDNSASLHYTGEYSDLVTYYHRGSSPYDNQAIIVGATDYTTSGSKDWVTDFSEVGPGVDVYAPGYGIMSACSTTNGFTGDEPYFFNSSYRQLNIPGTSMAAPQVAGVSALLLQLYPNIPSGSLPSFVKEFIVTNAVSESLYSTGLDNDYTSDTRSTLTTGSAKILFNPFGSNKNVETTGSLNLLNGLNLEFR
jgi:subtilisin family serine protease